MADITIEEIRKRHANYPWPEDQSWQDIDFLLAELERLKNVVVDTADDGDKPYPVKAGHLYSKLREVEKERDDLRAENVQLGDTVAALRATDDI